MEKYSKCKVCDGDIKVVNKTFDLVKCFSCQLVFSKQIFSEQEFIETYNKLYNSTNQYSTHIKEFENLQTLKKSKIGRTKSTLINYLLGKKIKRILEVGAGVGVVANFFKNKKRIMYTGIEFDKTTSFNARKLGLNIKTGSFKLMKDIDEMFDSIIAFEVIEHLQELNEFFKLSHSKLNKNAYLAFTVPNYDKRFNYKNYEDKIFQSGPPIHLNFFTKESIKNIAKLYNFEVLLLQEKKFPYINLKKKDTYKFIIRSLFSNYKGSTIKCVFKKN